MPDASGMLVAHFVNSFLERCDRVHETTGFAKDNMNPPASLALTVKEMEPGEFHWILLEEDESTPDHLGYKPRTIGDPEPNMAAAWVSGYMALRALLRKAA